MGRSQVLYNRTKGRGKNRSGRGGNRTSEDSTRSANAGNRRNYSGAVSTFTPREQYHPPGSAHRSQPKDYEHEYEVLFAGRNTYLSSKTREEDNGDDENLLLGGSVNGSICIPSMAATLESMKISTRLRIPMYVAAKAFPNRFQMVEEEKEAETEAAKGKTAVESPLETENNASNESSSDLDWLDDACGITDDIEEHPATKSEKKETPKDAPKDEKPSESPTDSHDGKNTTATNNSSAQAEEDFGDDNLDDWLDSVIE